MGRHFPHQTPPNQWPRACFYSSILFTLLSYQILIPCWDVAIVHASPSTRRRELRTPSPSVVVGGLDESEDARPHNLIPRFNIPRGNLSYQRIPYWEALYYLKYGLVPPTLRHDLFNETDLDRVLDYFGLINHSTHNRRSGDGTRPNSIPSEAWNEIENKMSGYGLLFKEGKLEHNGHDIDTEGVFTHKQGDKLISFYPSYDKLFDSLRDGLEFQVLDPSPPEDDSLPEYSDFVPLYPSLVPPNVALQMRFGFNRRPRAEVSPSIPVPPMNIFELILDSDQGSRNDRSEDIESNSGESKPIYRHNNVPELLFYLFPIYIGQQERQEDIFEPPKTSGFLQYPPQDTKQHYNKNPVYLLRKFLMDMEHDLEDQDSTTSENYNENESERLRSRLPQGSSRYNRNNLVSRSSGGDSVPRGDDNDSNQGGESGSGGVRNDQGRKFQTQGW